MKSEFKVFPNKKIGRLYHVGTLDATKKNRYSLEGDGLSVSNCPDVWMRITEGHTNGQIYEIQKNDMKLLDYYAMNASQKENIIQYGLKNELISKETIYRVTYYDDEMECDVSMLFEDRIEAIENAYEESDVKEIDGLIASNEWRSRMYTDIAVSLVFDFLVMEYAEHVLNYDGVYWNEKLDEIRYSAPRGVIFNSKLKECRIVKVG